MRPPVAKQCARCEQRSRCQQRSASQQPRYFTRVMGILVILAAAAWPDTSVAQQAPLLYSLEDYLDAPTTRPAALSPDGRWLVVTRATARDRVGVDNARSGDPTYISPSTARVLLVDTRTGEERPLFQDPAQVRALAWSPDGGRLAYMERQDDVYVPAIWERASGRVRRLSLPADRVLDSSSSLEWSADGARLLMAVRPREWLGRTAAAFDHLVRGPVVVLSSETPFLAWDNVRRLPLERTVALYDVAEGRLLEVVSGRLLRSYGMSADGEHVRFSEDRAEATSYVSGGSSSRLYVQPVAGGEPRVLLEEERGVTVRWSGDGLRYAYSRDGQLFLASLEEGAEPRRLAGEAPRRGAAADSAAEAMDSTARAAEQERRRLERFSPVRLNRDGSLLIASNSQGLWVFDTASGERTRFHDEPEEEEGEEEDPDAPPRPRWSVAAWSPDDRYIYLSYASREAWDNGLYRHDRQSGRTDELVRDGRGLGGWQLSEDGSTLLFTAGMPNRPGEIHVAEADFSAVRALSSNGAWFAGHRLADAELIRYRDVDGRLQNGVLYYPAEYQNGQRYPTVFLVYEDYFNPSFNGTINYLTANGYAVLQPSVALEEGYPGEGWLKGVTAAANALIERGLADPQKLGVYGTSYGGYATNLLITQTKRFAAAINISGKVNMVSFYTDSPRLGVRNVTAPERGQDRIGASLWEQPHKYLAHSAVMFADRIETPLLLMTGEQDSNVPARQAMEMYYALRRLGRPVEWVNYMNGGHGMPRSTVEEIVDYHERILGWFDRWLKGNGERVADDSGTAGGR
ncbi:MAG: prolyl oligopeptidase family serine peptidase [Gemmatimonadota bacterium]